MCRRWDIWKGRGGTCRAFLLSSLIRAGWEQPLNIKKQEGQERRREVLISVRAPVFSAVAARQLNQHRAEI